MRIKAAVLGEVGAKAPYAASKPLRIEEVELDARPGQGWSASTPRPVPLRLRSSRRPARPRDGARPQALACRGGRQGSATSPGRPRGLRLRALLANATPSRGGRPCASPSRGERGVHLLSRATRLPARTARRSTTSALGLREYATSRATSWQGLPELPPVGGGAFGCACNRGGRGQPAGCRRARSGGDRPARDCARLGPSPQGRAHRLDRLATQAGLRPQLGARRP